VTHRSTPRNRVGPALAVLATLLLAPASFAGPPAALAEGHDSAAASFDRFADSWMERMRTNGQTRKGTAYTGYGANVQRELRATGSPRAPWVGILHYDEHVYQCSNPSRTSCGVTRTTPVTEIFRFQNGRWVY